MENYIFWTFMLAVLAVLSGGIAVFVRAYVNGTTPSALLFRPRSERRLEVVDHASLDGRRKLVLIRRDDVEHLLMTGGPVDVVIETGISSAVKRGSDAATPKENVATRRLPIFGRSTETADTDAGGREL
jgi:flagellar protein FliO/FliZ